MFDPYHRWLGIPLGERPPTHYQLLAISPDEQDAEVIQAANLRQSAYVRTMQAGPHAADAARILNEIAAAAICLSDLKKRSEYDARLAGGPTPLSRTAKASADPVRPLGQSRVQPLARLPVEPRTEIGQPQSPSAYTPPPLAPLSPVEGAYVPAPQQYSGPLDGYSTGYVYAPASTGLSYGADNSMLAAYGMGAGFPASRRKKSKSRGVPGWAIGAAGAMLALLVMGIATLKLLSAARTERATVSPTAVAAGIGDSVADAAGSTAATVAPVQVGGEATPTVNKPAVTDVPIEPNQAVTDTPNIAPADIAPAPPPVTPAVTIAASPPAENLPPGTLLRWKLQVGDTLEFATHRFDTTVIPPELKTDYPNNIKTTLWIEHHEWTVQKIDDDGVAHVVVTLTRKAYLDLVGDRNAATGRTVYDTREDPRGQHTELYKEALRDIGTETRFLFSSAGAIFRTQIDPKTVKNLKFEADEKKKRDAKEAKERKRINSSKGSKKKGLVPSEKPTEAEEPKEADNAKKFDAPGLGEEGPDGWYDMLAAIISRHLQLFDGLPRDSMRVGDVWPSGGLRIFFGPTPTVYYRGKPVAGLERIDYNLDDMANAQRGYLLFDNELGVVREELQASKGQSNTPYGLSKHDNGKLRRLLRFSRDGASVFLAPYESK